MDHRMGLSRQSAPVTSSGRSDKRRERPSKGTGSMNEEQMLADHQEAWASFVRVATIATGIVIAILALMAITLL
jgi:hypothetical protein